MSSDLERASEEGKQVPLAQSVAYDRDDNEVLEQLGYEPQFKRDLTLWSTLAISFSILGLLPSMGTTMFYTIEYIGAPSMTWGWIVALLGIQAVANSMAELCSAMPTSGGSYYCTAVLAPKKYAPFLTWITGWSNYVGAVTGGPAVDYSLASLLLSFGRMRNPDFVIQTWHVFLLTLALMTVHATMASMPTRWLAWVNKTGTTFNSVALLVVMIVLLANNKRPDPHWNSNNYAWSEFNNLTDWPNGIAMLMSFASIIWVMSGYDAPFHLSEECSNASVAVPKAIVLTSSIGGIVGWLFQLIIAYTIVDIPSVLESAVLGQPFSTYCVQVVGTKAAEAVVALTCIGSFFMGQGTMIAASRLQFAYARDGCYPFSRYFNHVNKYTQTPVNSVLINTFIGMCIACLMFGGAVTINAVFNIGAVAVYSAFTIPILLRLVYASKFRPGPWHLGWFSRINAVFACSFVLLMVPILCFPQYRGADNVPVMMNWTALVYGAPMLFAVIWYIVDAHKWFKGPKIHSQHLIWTETEEGVEIAPPVSEAPFSPEGEKALAS